jgi:FixJ family two-component response regulator
MSGAAMCEWVAIVDDHESMRSSLARVFRLENIPAIAFASAEEYLECSMPSAPCCLVLDMQLPGMRGLELAQFLHRTRPPLPPVIFISAHEDLLASLDGSSLAHGCLRKPFDLDELLGLVRPLVAGDGVALNRAAVR